MYMYIMYIHIYMHACMPSPWQGFIGVVSRPARQPGRANRPANQDEGQGMSRRQARETSKCSVLSATQYSPFIFMPRMDIAC